jgi:hypothetical protein
MSKPTGYNRNAYRKLSQVPPASSFSCYCCGKDAEVFHGNYAQGVYTAYCRPCNDERDKEHRRTVNYGI